MKQAKRIASLLLAVAMVFTLVFAHGNIFGVFAEGDVKVLLDQNFDEEEIGSDGGWTNNTATPEPNPAAGYEQWLKHSVAASPDGSSNAFHIIGNPYESSSIPSTLYQKKLDEPTTSITLTYDVFLNAHTTRFDAILPVPLYTGAADAQLDAGAAPVQLQALWLENSQSPLYFSLGAGDYEKTNEKLDLYKWYTFQIEVDTSKETYQEGVKISYGLKGGVLTEIDLPEPTRDANKAPVWKQGATMDRISTGFGTTGKTEMYLDNIKATTAAEESPEIGEESVLSEDFESYDVGNVAGWTLNEATTLDTNSSYAVAVTPDNSSKAFEMKGNTKHALFQKELEKEVNNIKLTYDVYFKQVSLSGFDAFLPVPLYALTEDTALDVAATPVQLEVIYDASELHLYYALGRAAYESADMTLKFDTWYTVQIEVNTAKADNASGVKISLAPRGGELTELVLPEPTKDGNKNPVWIKDRAMDRISAGFNTIATTDMFLDNIQATTVYGYSANLSVNKDDIDVNDPFAVQVEVDHDSLDQYSAGEFKVSYNQNLVTFNGVTNAVTGEEAIGIRYSDVDGVVTVEDFGNDNALPATYELNFTAKAEGNAAFELQSAAFIDKANASKSDLLPILNDPAVVNFTIEPAPYTVTIEDENDYIINDATEVRHNATYTFNVVDSDKYTYTITATMGGAPVDAVPGENGSYSIANVTGDLAISVTRTATVFNVTINGETAANDGANATCEDDYTFTLLPNVAPGVNPGTDYSVESVTIGGNAYNGHTSNDGRTYTIPRADINGDIVITIKEESVDATQFSVIVTGSGAGAAGSPAPGTLGQDYTLTLTPAAGYSYSVTATVNGQPVDVTSVGNDHTVTAVNGTLTFDVTATVITEGVTVHDYITLNGTKMWLVLQDAELGDNNHATYNGETMFYSGKYEAYAYLVKADTLELEDAKELIGVASGAAIAIDYSNDVNLTGKIDASDAQYTYNIYNIYYNSFTEDETMYEFLLADTDDNIGVNVRDAVAIINDILTP